MLLRLFFMTWRSLPTLALWLMLASCGGGGGGSGGNGATPSSRQQQLPSLSNYNVSPQQASPNTNITMAVSCLATGPAHYRWDFGDGQSLQDGPSVVKHMYDIRGEDAIQSYKLSVTCSDDIGTSPPLLIDLPVNPIDRSAIANLECSASNGSQGWCRQYPSQITPTITSAAVLNSATQFGISGGQLLVSSDGGLNWRLQADLPSRASLSALSPFQGRTAWAVGEDGTILRTTNGGASWLAQASGTTRRILGIAAVDAQTAWAVTGSQILKTTNGGQTWAIVHDDGGDSPIAHLSALDANRVWVATSTGVWRSTDGGTSWRSLPLPDNAWLGSLSAVSSQVIWATTDGRPARVLRSEDGGENWLISKTMDDVPYVTPQMQPHLVKVVGLSGDHAWLIGQKLATKSDFGVLWETLDGGRSWTPAKEPLDTPINEVAMVDGIVQWAYGNGAVLHLDSNKAWASVSSFDKQSLALRIGAANAKVAWAVGNNGLILKTDSEGVKWEKQNSGTAAALTGVSVGDERTVWAVGQKAGILNTTDGGLSWSHQAQAFTDLVAISAASRQVAWAGGADGQIIQTIDGGQHWAAATVNPGQGGGLGIAAVKAVSGERAWAITLPRNVPNVGPMVLRTTANNEWTAVPLPYQSAAGWHALAVPKPKVIWLVARTNLALGQARPSTLLLSDDDGASWQIRQTPATTRLQAFEAFDENQAWLSTEKGQWRTRDGGQHWTQQTSSDLMFSSITAIDANVLWSLGSATGFIYKTVTGGD